MINYLLKKSSNDKYSLPPLGVGLAIYLPSAVITPVVLGAVLGYYFEKSVGNSPAGETAKRLAVLIMSGFIVGESLFNVALAGLIVVSGEGEPLAIATSLTEAHIMLISLVVAVFVVTGLYRWAGKRGKEVTA